MVTTKITCPRLPGAHAVGHRPFRLRESRPQAVREPDVEEHPFRELSADRLRRQVDHEERLRADERVERRPLAADAGDDRARAIGERDAEKGQAIGAGYRDRRADGADADVERLELRMIDLRLDRRRREGAAGLGRALREQALDLAEMVQVVAGVERDQRAYAFPSRARRACRTDRARRRSARRSSGSSDRAQRPEQRQRRVRVARSRPCSSRPAVLVVGLERRARRRQDHAEAVGDHAPRRRPGASTICAIDHRPGPGDQCSSLRRRPAISAPMRAGVDASTSSGSLSAEYDIRRAEYSWNVSFTRHLLAAG